MIVLGLRSLFLLLGLAGLVREAATEVCVEKVEFPLGYVRRTYYIGPNCLGDPFYETLERTGVCLPLYGQGGTTIIGSTLRYLSKDLRNLCPATDDKLTEATVHNFTLEPTIMPSIEPSPTAMPTPSRPTWLPLWDPTKQAFASKAMARRLLAARELAANVTIYTIFRQDFATYDCSGASNDFYDVEESDNWAWIYNGECRPSYSVRSPFTMASIRDVFHPVPDNTTSAISDRFIPRPPFSFQGKVVEFFKNELDCKSPTKSQMPVLSGVYPVGTCVPGYAELNLTGSSFKIVNNLDSVAQQIFPDSSSCSGQPARELNLTSQFCVSDPSKVAGIATELYNSFKTIVICGRNKKLVPVTVTDPNEAGKEMKCVPCEAGSESMGIDSTSCTLCKAGYFNPDSQRMDCTQCPEGKFSGGIGSVDCELCPVATYNSLPGAASCTHCSGGKTTPRMGTVSGSACLLPKNNFIMGGTALSLVFVVAFIYVILGGFHYAAFIRRERVVKQQVKEYNILALELSNSQKMMADELSDKSVDLEIQKVIAKYSKKDNEGNIINETATLNNNNSFCSGIGEVVKIAIFFLLSFGCTLFVTLFVFAVFLAQVFFKSLIIWKQSKNFIPVLDYRSVVERIIFKILTALAYLPGLDFLKFLLSLLGQIFGLLADFKIDFSAVGVTCKGSGAPFELLLNLAVLGIVILVVESELQTFQQLCFQLTIRRYASKLLSRENILYGLKDVTRVLPFIMFCGGYVLRLLGLLLIQVLFHVINFQSVLQFCMSLVQIKAFAASRDRLHAYSDTCNQVHGFENADTYLAHSSSYFAFVLILPVFYEVSKILCPKVPEEADTQEAKSNHHLSILSETNAKSSLPSKTQNTKGPLALEETKSSSSTVSKEQVDDGSILKIFSTLPYPARIRLPLTVLSPDLMLAHLTQGLVSILREAKPEPEPEPELANHKVVGPLMNPNHSQSKDAGNAGPVLINMFEKHKHKHASSSSICSIWSIRAYRSLYSFLSSVVSTLRPMDSEEESRWVQEQVESRMPSYWEVLQTELWYMCNTCDYLKPPLSRDKVDPSYPLVGHFLSFLMLLFPIGHVMTSFGQFVARLVFLKFCTFFSVALGWWSTKNSNVYNVQKKARELGDGLEDKDDDVNGEKYSRAYASNALANCLTAIVAPRAIVLQIVPQLVYFSVFAIAASSSPLFVHDEYLRGKISRLLVLDCFDEAYRVELQSYNKNSYNKNVKPYRWILVLSGISIFILESRAIVFAVNVFMVFVAIYVNFQAVSNRLIGCAVAIFFPVALAHSLRMVVVLGRAMNIKDIWDLQSSSENIIESYNAAKSVQPPLQPEEMHSYIKEHLRLKNKAELACKVGELEVKAHSAAAMKWRGTGTGTGTGTDKDLKRESSDPTTDSETRQRSILAPLGMDKGIGMGIGMGRRLSLASAAAATTDSDLGTNEDTAVEMTHIIVDTFNPLPQQYPHSHSHSYPPDQVEIETGKDLFFNASPTDRTSFGMEGPPMSSMHSESQSQPRPLAMQNPSMNAAFSGSHSHGLVVKNLPKTTTHVLQSSSPIKLSADGAATSGSGGAGATASRSHLLSPSTHPRQINVNDRVGPKQPKGI